MNAHPIHTESAPLPCGGDAQPCSDDAVPELVARMYEDAPPLVRERVLEQLLQPLGVLSLAAVANGIFAKMALGRNWSQLKVSTEDAMHVHARDIVALVQHVQQVSVQAVDGLTCIIASTPVLTSSAAAAVLMSLLANRSMRRGPVLGNDFDPLL